MIDRADMNRIWQADVVMVILMMMAFLIIPGAGKAESLLWSASSGQVDGYKVNWGTSKSSQPNNRDVGDTTRYDLIKLPLTEGTTYFLSVSAYNSVGESPPCAPVVFTPGDNTPPAPPGGLSAD